MQHPLIWSATPPTAPGWYWRRDDRPARVVRVGHPAAYPAVLQVVDGSYFGTLAEYRGGAWAGPLCEPVEG